MSDMIYNFIDFIFTIIDFMIFFRLLTNKLTSNLSKKKQIFLYFASCSDNVTLPCPDIFAVVP